MQLQIISDKFLHKNIIINKIFLQRMFLYPVDLTVSQSQAVVNMKQALKLSHYALRLQGKLQERRNESRFPALYFSCQTLQLWISN